MNSSKKSCLAVVMVIMLILAFSLPVMADDSVNSDPVTQSSEPGNAPDTASNSDSVAGENQAADNEGTEAGASEDNTAGDAVNDAPVDDNPAEDNPAEDDPTEDNAVDTESAASETPADVTADQPVANSGSGAPAPVVIPSEVVHTSMQIRNSNISAGQDIVIDVTSVLADGLASVAVSRMAIELTKFSGPIDSGEVLVFAGSEQIGLTDQDGAAKGYWTPSEPISLDRSNPSVTCTFILKFMLGGEYNLNIFADGVHYQVEEQIVAPAVNPQAPVPEVVEDPLAGIDETQEGLDEAGNQVEENPGEEADSGTGNDQESNETGVEDGIEQGNDSGTEENGSGSSGDDGSGGAQDDEAGIIEDDDQGAGVGGDATGDAGSDEANDGSDSGSSDGTSGEGI